jgi:hypothetical protein
VIRQQHDAAGYHEPLDAFVIFSGNPRINHIINSAHAVEMVKQILVMLTHVYVHDVSSCGGYVCVNCC